MILMPIVFYFSRHILELANFEYADYMLSVCADETLREVSSPRKCGKVFFLSKENRFIIKTLRKSEVKVMNSIFGCLIRFNDEIIHVIQKCVSFSMVFLQKNVYGVMSRCQSCFLYKVIVKLITGSSYLIWQSHFSLATKTIPFAGSKKFGSH